MKHYLILLAMALAIPFAAKADHDHGPYVVGVTDEVNEGYFCPTEEVAKDVLQAGVNNWDAAVEHYLSGGCGAKTLTITVVGQIGQDYRGANGYTWRIVHVTLPDEAGKSLYLLTAVQPVIQPQ